MKRARMDPPDSLEMLLDTMCNTFGGIILIALLIALFARDSQSPTAPSSSHRESSEMFRERIEQAEADLARAVALEQELEARVTTPAQADLLQLLEQRDQVRSAADSLVSDLKAASSPASTAATLAQTVDRIETLASQNARAEALLIEQKLQGARLKGRITEQGRGLQVLSNRLAQVTARQTQRVRLPQERPTTKGHLYLIVRHARVYPLYWFVDGAPSPNTTTLRWIQESEGSRRIETIPEAGIRPQTDAAALTATLRSIPANQIYLVFQVFPDSFEAFNLAKAAAVAAGFDYTWEPRLENTPLRLGAGAPPPPPL
jgi:hypothetical protein